MKTHLLVGIIVSFWFWNVVVTSVQAIYPPLQVDNNRFGIHISHESDIPQAAELLNSSGGDWGYVTLVIREDERNVEQWQHTFDQLRRYHLIPLVRIATKMNHDSWDKPYPHQAGEWAGFLNRLNWVIKNRYVILFNEPNHAKEWGGDIKPEEYSAVVTAFTQELKNASPDFFILPAALDAAAPDGSDTMNSVRFMKLMQQADTGVFSNFDGWNTHAYPNPGFSGSPWDVGIATIRGYLTEIQVAKQLGLKNDPPIFITETGWSHNGNGNSSPTNLTPDQVARNFQTAFTSVWTDSRIVAITPFILNYPHPPFQTFSWQKTDSLERFPQFDTVKELAKPAGRPTQIHAAVSNRLLLPQELITNKIYQGELLIHNTGQSIWQTQSIKLEIQSNPLSLDIANLSRHQIIEPGQTFHLPIRVETSNTLADYPVTWQLSYAGEPLSAPATHTFTLRPPNVVTSFKIWLFQSVHQQSFHIVN